MLERMFLSGNFYRMQAELEQSVAKLRPADSAPRLRLAGLAAVFGKVDALGVTLSRGAFDAAVAMQAAMEQFSVAVEQLGIDLSSSWQPGEMRRMEVSSWLFELLYDNRLDDTRLWWLGYYPARAWERLVFSLPLSWFRDDRA